jgi:peptidyl-prolyl cis-trans isomerase D
MAFMKAHAADLTRPELRTFTLVRFSAAALAPAITIDPAAVEKAFAAKKDSLSKPETRTLIEIPVRSAAQGQAAAAALAKGEAPSAVAAAMGSEPVIWTDKAQTDITDRRIATVAFSMKPGEVRGPVQGDVGLAALKLVKVAPGGVATLENSRAKIETDLRAEAAKNKAYELSQKFDDARQAGSSVADAASKAGVSAISVGPLTAQGIGLDGKPSPLVNDKILKSAFGAGPGEDTDLEDAGPGDYFALHLDKITPPALPPLAQFRPQLAKAWTTEQFVTALKAKADGLMAQLRRGASMETVASSVGAHVVHQVGMQRVNAEQFKAMGRDFLVGVFTAKAGDVFAAPAPNGVFVARLDAVRPGDLTAMARAAQVIAPRVSQAFSQNLLDSVRAASRRTVKTTINLAMARQAIGVDTSTLPKTATVGRPGGKSK